MEPDRTQSRPCARGPVVLLTDFGLRDHYVGVMKGVIASLAPETTVLDLTHEVPPQDVRTGAYLLLVSYRYFPEGSVFVAVVDPGVGTERRALLLSAAGRFFLAPDNGLLSLVMAQEPGWVARELAEPRFFLPAVSRTFHGRDVFAPCAAHLVRGVPPEDFGPRVTDPVLLPGSEPVEEGGRIVGAVLHVDRFGNLITNVSAAKLRGRRVRRVLFAGRPLPLGRTYADVPRGQALALVGSDGFLEIAVSCGSAAQELGPEGEVVVELDESEVAPEA